MRETAVDVQMGRAHNDRMLHGARPIRYFLLHDYEVDALERGERVIELDVFYAALGMLLTALPGIVSEADAIAAGQFSFAALWWLAIALVSATLALALGGTGYRKRRAVRTMIAEMKARPQFPISEIPELDYRRA